MEIAVFILLAAALAAIPASFLLFPRSRFPRWLTVTALTGVILFCGFGFLESFEFSERAQRWPWQAGYAAVALACGAGIRRLLRNGAKGDPGAN